MNQSKGDDTAGFVCRRNDIIFLLNTDELWPQDSPSTQGRDMNSHGSILILDRIDVLLDAAPEPPEPGRYFLFR